MNNEYNKVTKTEQLPIERIIYGFDRLSFYLDVSNPNLCIETLKKHCTDLKVRHSKIKFLLIWTTQVDVFQPDEECLKLIYQHIQNSGCRVKFKYVEISADFITSSFRDARIIKNYLLAHIYIDAISSKVYFNGKFKTYYFRPRSESSKKCPINFVLYHDRSSKLNNIDVPEKCCHVELRLTGSNAINQFGVISFKDLLDFDFPQFYRDHIKVVKLKSKVSFARLIKSSSDVSGTALRNYADKTFDDCHVGGVFVMQELVHQHPEAKTLLKPLTSSSLFKE